MHDWNSLEQLVHRRAVIAQIRVPDEKEANLCETTRHSVWYTDGKRIRQSTVELMHHFFEPVKAK